MWVINPHNFEENPGVCINENVVLCVLKPAVAAF